MLHHTASAVFAPTCLNTPVLKFQVYQARPWLAASGVFDDKLCRTLVLQEQVWWPLLDDEEEGGIGTNKN